MVAIMTALATFIQVVRSAFFIGGGVFLAVAVVDWAARTRRLNPFSGLSRYMRTTVDPRLAGIERQVVRAGGHPAATPWWALVVYVVLASLVLAGLDLVVEILRDVWFASERGPTGILILAIHWTFRILAFALIVRVISSWFPRLAASRWVRWTYPATEWMLRPLRRLIPTLGMIDITPILAYFALQLLESLIFSVFFRGA